MTRTFILLIAAFMVLTGISLNAVSQTANHWIEVATNDEVSISIRRGSVQASQNDGGTRIIVGVARYFNKRTGSADVVRMYVSDQDCEVGYGSLVLLDLQGKFLHENEMVIDGKTIASTVATALCSVRPTSRQQQPSSSFNPNRI